VSVGYADTFHGSFVPSPWAGSPNVNFVGTGPPYDAGAIRLDNASATPIPGVTVRVTIGTANFNLWGTNTIPANGSLILTQTAFYNFDTTDVLTETCIGSPNTTVPVIHVTINGVTTNYRDTSLVLTSGGIDKGGPPCFGSEGHQWVPVS
jgi:hypothetical protein